MGVLLLRALIWGLVLAALTFFWVVVLDSNEQGLTESFSRNVGQLAVGRETQPPR